MISLKSQTVEVPASAVVLMTAFSAALTGILIGFASARRSRSRSAGRASPPESEAAARLSWRRINERGDDGRRVQERIESIRRDYELDIGLLKQELRQLRETAETTHVQPVRIDADANGAGSEGRGSIRFSPLEQLSGEIRRGDPDR